MFRFLEAPTPRAGFIWDCAAFHNRSQPELAVLLKSFVHFYPSCDVMLEMNVKIQTEYLDLLRLLNFRLEGNEENMRVFFF